jgi:hypothetical protein
MVSKVYAEWCSAAVVGDLRCISIGGCSSATRWCSSSKVRNVSVSSV